LGKQICQWISPLQAIAPVKIPADLQLHFNFENLHRVFSGALAAGSFEFNPPDISRLPIGEYSKHQENCAKDCDLDRG